MLLVRSSKMPERCVAACCSNVKDPDRNISMHRIPFFGDECPIKKKRRKKCRLRVREEEDVGAREDLLVVL